MTAIRGQDDKSELDHSIFADPADVDVSGTIVSNNESEHSFIIQVSQYITEDNLQMTFSSVVVLT